MSTEVFVNEAYREYMYPTDVNWSSTEDVKNSLQRVDLTKGPYTAGLPIVSDGKTVYCDRSDAHTAIIAVSGMKKSLCAIGPTIASLAAAGENMVITDPKGELYDRTCGVLKEHGYKVLCLDFRTMDKDGFNILKHPARVYRYYDKDAALVMASNIISIFSEEQRSSKHCDPFWPITATTFLRGICELMFDAYQDLESINLCSLASNCVDSQVRYLKEMLMNTKNEDTAVINLNMVLSEPEKTLASTLSTASSFLSPFIQNDKLARMISHSTFELKDLCEEKTALFIINDDSVSTCDSIIGIIISQIQNYLIQYAYKSKKRRLERRVNFILDEFTSFPIPEAQMMSALATHRSRNIRYFLVIQSLACLQEKYTDYESLLANCSNLLYMGSTERELLDMISNRCGYLYAQNRPLITTRELMDLKQEWYSKEAIYLNLAKGIRYCTVLPSIEAYDFGNQPPYHYTIEHPKVKVYTVENLLCDVSTGLAFAPFSKHHVQNNKPDFKKQSTEDIQATLTAKFDELFEAINEEA